MTTMTMVWIQTHAREVRNANKAVLSYLAFRAHYDNGLGAWPAVETIADACGISIRTVQRSLEWLMENGWIELGQQDFSGFNPKTGKPIRRDRRTVVWNVICKDAPMPSEPTEAVEENVPPSDVVSGALTRAGKHASDKMSPRENAGIPTGKHASDKMSPRAGGNIGIAADTIGASDKMSRKNDKMSPNIQGYTNPSAPTGHLPAGGETPGKDDDDAAADADARSVADALKGMRSKLGLPAPEPTERDLRHASRLLDRVAAEHGGDRARALGAVLDVIRWMPRNPFWLRRILTAGHLDSQWNGILNDFAVDGIEAAQRQDRTEHDGRGDAAPTQPHTHTWLCRHVLDRLGATREAVSSDDGLRARAVRVADELNRHDGNAPQRAPRHVHTAICEHVKAGMMPHWNEYDHNGSLRWGHPSPWQIACQNLADELNRRDGIPASR